MVLTKTDRLNLLVPCASLSVDSGCVSGFFVDVDELEEIVAVVVVAVVFVAAAVVAAVKSENAKAITKPISIYCVDCFTNIFIFNLTFFAFGNSNAIKNTTQVNKNKKTLG